MSKEVLLKPTS